MTCFSTPKKEILPKATFKAKKGSFMFFHHNTLCLIHIYGNRVIILGMQSIPEFSYGSLPYAQIKIFALYYKYLGVKVTFLPKIWVSE